jgi:hypothetical protein
MRFQNAGAARNGRQEPRMPRGRKGVGELVASRILGIRGSSTALLTLFKLPPSISYNDSEQNLLSAFIIAHLVADRLLAAGSRSLPYGIRPDADHLAHDRCHRQRTGDLLLPALVGDADIMRTHSDPLASGHGSGDTRRHSLILQNFRCETTGIEANNSSRLDPDTPYAKWFDGAPEATLTRHQTTIGVQSE